VCFSTGEDGHYKTFEEVYGTETTEEYRQSLHATQAMLTSGHAMPFSPSTQTAKTCQMTVQCIDCEKPCAIYSASKLNGQENALLVRILNLYQYSYGSELQELKPNDVTRAPRISSLLDKVFVRQNLTCQSSVEVP
jgi:hypothetical protein